MEKWRQPEPTAAVSARDSVIPPYAARASEMPFPRLGSGPSGSLTVAGLGRLTVSSLNIDRFGVCSDS